MNAAFRRFLPFLYSTLLVVTLTGLVLKLRYDLEVNLEVQRLEILLEGLCNALSEQLDRGARLAEPATTAAPTPPWQISHFSLTSGYTDLNGGPPPIAELPLKDALTAAKMRDGEMRLLGPFATEGSDNALAIVVPVHDPTGKPLWSVISAPIGAIMANLDVGTLMKQGYRLQLANTGDSTAVYQTEEGGLDGPITANFRFGASRLQWRAAPRAGWHAPPRFLTSTLFIIMGVLLWLAYEFRRGRQLRVAAADLEESDARRREVNTLYGKTLETLATLESRMQVVSMYDSVTGLANRNSMERRIEATLDTMRQAPHGVLCILAIGFDHVSHITRSFGSEFMSRVLVIAAERVEFVLPSKDKLFRLGEFQLAIVLPHVTPGTGEELSQTIITEIESPISLDGHNFMLHPRIGIVETALGYEEPAMLIDRANSALEAVRRDAVSRYCLFDSSTSKESAIRLQLEADLNRAFDENQFQMQYEPIVLPVSNSVAGFEALVNWVHPTEGIISAARLLPIAAQAGLSHRLNTWVMRAAANQANLWRRHGYSHLFVIFKLSADAFLRPDLVDELGDAMAEFGIQGKSMMIELTESALIQDISGASRMLKLLNELQVGTWLGSFGTGYSSLSYLRALPLRGVKIDRSFIERTVTDARDFGFLKSLIDLISYLGMQSIADGVQTKEQYELLSLTTCDLYQGNYFSTQMSAERVNRWMQERGGALAEGACA